jgi:sugar phosphate isomerase/epimerase
MNPFVVTGFADEIDPDFQTQLNSLNTLGIGFIELRGINRKNVSLLSGSEVQAVKNQLELHGIRVSSIGSPIGKISITDDFSSHLDMVKQVVETAHTLDSQFIRVFSFYIPKAADPSLYRNEVIDRMGAIIEIARDSGIIILHENEKAIYGDIPERCLDLMETLKAPQFASVFDPANFIQCGAEAYPAGFHLLRPYIRYVHIKDALTDGRNMPAGQGAGRIEELLTDLIKDGYQGFVSLEPHLGSFEGLGNLEKSQLVDSLEPGGMRAFRIAHEALQSILIRIGGEIQI